jgi:hypothetical protein
MNTRLVIVLTFFVLILIGGCLYRDLQATRADAQAWERQFGVIKQRKAKVEKDILEAKDRLRQSPASTQERATVAGSAATLEELQRELSQKLVTVRRFGNNLRSMYPNSRDQDLSALLADLDELARQGDEVQGELQRVQGDIQKIQNQLVAAPVVPQPVPATLPMPVSVSSTQHRRALIIGNAAYTDAPLRNPVNDATDVADTLRRVGFEITLLRDADKPTMEQAIEAFTRGVPRGSIGLFFFSGHGAQIDGLNYLIPIGARLNESIDVKYRAVAADWILGRMDETGMEVKLLILDACRNNPFGRSWTRALDRGLAVMDAPKGTLIAYATGPKKTAADGTGRNSPYTARLLREIPLPGRPIELVFKAVRLGVQQETQGEQTPWEASSLTGEFYFAQ